MEVGAHPRRTTTLEALVRIPIHPDRNHHILGCIYPLLGIARRGRINYLGALAAKKAHLPRILSLRLPARRTRGGCDMPRVREDICPAAYSSAARHQPHRSDLSPHCPTIQQWRTWIDRDLALQGTFTPTPIHAFATCRIATPLACLSPPRAPLRTLLRPHY